MNVPSLADINAFLRDELAVDRYPADEQDGIYQPTARHIRRLGLVLEPFPKLTEWLLTQQIDAVWLHRPWQLPAGALPPGVGVLYHHLPFDETLTMAYNRPLAAQLTANGPPEPLGYKQATMDGGEALPQRPIGMLLTVAELEFDGCLARIKTLFGGYDRAEAGHQTTVGRLAVVGAMTDALVREAAERGAQLYLTGQYRKPAQEAVNDTGLAVIAVGHRRSEEWGLRALAALLTQHWPALTVDVGS